MNSSDLVAIGIHTTDPSGRVAGQGQANNSNPHRLEIDVARME